MTKESMKFGDKDYYLVPGRLKRFREENPRAKVDSNPTYNPDGSITIKTVIVKDQADEYSAIGSGSARYSETELKKAKAYEKLETISVGRALSNVGYLNDGQIASTEELEEFREQKLDKALETIRTAKKREDFISILSGLTPEQKREATPIINERIKELQDATR